jgi:hypothetical protein
MQLISTFKVEEDLERAWREERGNGRQKLNTVRSRARTA